MTEKAENVLINFLNNLIEGMSEINIIKDCLEYYGFRR